MVKNFKDVNGKKVVIGDMVSIVNGDYKEGFKVTGMERSRRKIEVELYNDVIGRYYIASSKLVSEM